MLRAQIMKVGSLVAVTLAIPEMASRAMLKSVPKTAAQPAVSPTLCRAVTIFALKLLSVSLSREKQR